MSVDPYQVQYASTLDTLKNFDSTVAVINVPAQSYTAGQFRVFTTTVNLDRVDNLFGVVQHFSSFPNDYWLTSFIALREAAGTEFAVQTALYLNGDVLTIELYVVNQVGTTETCDAITATFTIKQYLAPFN